MDSWFSYSARSMRRLMTRRGCNIEPFSCLTLAAAELGRSVLILAVSFANVTIYIALYRTHSCSQGD